MMRITILILVISTSTTVFAQFHQPPQSIVTSAPINIFESSKYSSYSSSSSSVPVPIPIHQTASQPVRISQSFALPPVPSQYQHYQNQQNYYSAPAPRYGSYPQPQHLPSNYGYTNINTIGTPYQMYSNALIQGPPIQGPSSSSSTLPRHNQNHNQNQNHFQQHLFNGGFQKQSGFIAEPSRPTHSLPNSNSNLNSISNNHAIRTLPRTSPKLIYTAPANKFLGNQPAANSVYGAPIGPSSISEPSHQHQDKIHSFSSSQPASSPEIEDTWEALEASIDSSRETEHVESKPAKSQSASYTPTDKEAQSPAASSVYGSSVDSPPSTPPSLAVSGPEIEDTWEALEASLDNVKA